MRWVAAVGVCALVSVSCASGNTGGEGNDDAGGARDAGIDAAVVDPPDAAPPVTTCEECTANNQCPDDHLCASVGGTKACVPACSEADPSCPEGFTCGGVKMTFCAPDDGLCCIDADDDEYGTGIHCEGPDCNDDDDTIHPGADDLCNEIDDDCDPGTDDGSTDPLVGVDCDGDDTDLCEEGLSYCEAGAILCDDVTGDILDICNGIDDDCNTATLDGSGDPAFGTACDSPGDPDLCFDDQNVCDSAMGMIVCQDMAGGAVDLCDGLDNDCNPATADGDGDPGVGVACDGADTDLCNEGFTECTGGAIVCNDTTGDNPDICDGLDNDCNPSTLDGSQDPMSGVLCDGADSDLCEEGQWVCTGGFLSCNDFTGDTVELCNTLDDDCDGIADDDPDATMCTREHGSPPGVTAWTCSGTCSISGCTSSTADLDGIISNGCECTGVDTLANSCAAASPRSVGLGASINVSGKITTAGGSDWIRFDFTNRPAPQTYQPKVQLTGGVGDFLMDVETSCGVNAGCSDGPAVGIEFWDRLWFYFSGPGCCSDAVGHITSVRVRVYRPDGVASCDSYTVTATNL